MPQPFLKVAPKGTLQFNFNHGPFENRAALATKAMVAISDWAHAELALKNLFIGMLGANPRPAATVFSVLTGSATQQAALRAVADLILDEELRSVFDAIMWFHKSVAKMRHRIAHWVWGYVQEIPDAVALVNPDSIVDYNVWRKDTMTLVKKTRYGRKPEPLKSVQEHTWVYYEKDFGDISRDTRELNSLISAFGTILHIAPLNAAKHILRHPFFQDASRKESDNVDEGYRQLLDRLKAQPRISEFLIRLQKRQKSTQADSSQSTDSEP